MPLGSIQAPVLTECSRLYPVRSGSPLRIFTRYVWHEVLSHALLGGALVSFILFATNSKDGGSRAYGVEISFYESEDHQTELGRYSNPEV